mmetsp:Transcript_42072/g.87907  ORF Transcript_42072/g.87907 Transcript_42072/m.87907 type:complete len:107 (-) Transcript_42072:441-761(-)
MDGRIPAPQHPGIRISSTEVHNRSFNHSSWFVPFVSTHADLSVESDYGIVFFHEQFSPSKLICWSFINAVVFSKAITRSRLSFQRPVSPQIGVVCASFVNIALISF